MLKINSNCTQGNQFLNLFTSESNSNPCLLHYSDTGINHIAVRGGHRICPHFSLESRRNGGAFHFSQQKCLSLLYFFHCPACHIQQEPQYRHGSAFPVKEQPISQASYQCTQGVHDDIIHLASSQCITVLHVFNACRKGKRRGDGNKKGNSSFAQHKGQGQIDDYLL